MAQRSSSTRGAKPVSPPAGDTALRQRMVRLHQVLQPLGQHMGVDLRRRDVGVAEQQLQAAQIGAARQHVAGKGMAQHVRRHPRRIEAGVQRHLLQDLAEALPGQRLARLARRETASGLARARARAPPPRRAPRPTAARSAPCRPCRAPSAPPRRRPARVRGRRQQFRHPQPGGVEHLQRRPHSSRLRPAAAPPPPPAARRPPARSDISAAARGSRGVSSSAVGSSARTPSRTRKRWNWRSADSRRAAVRADRPAAASAAS